MALTTHKTALEADYEPERGGKDFWSVQSDHGECARDSEFSDHAECDSRRNERHLTCKRNSKAESYKFNVNIATLSFLL